MRRRWYRRALSRLEHGRLPDDTDGGSSGPARRVPVVLDGDGVVTGDYGVIATPTAFLLDRDGPLLGRSIGPRDWGSAETKAALAALLG
jgi:hypothetical protein